jgi:hypothetical protein
MPRVGTKHFSYTAKGKRDAKKYAKKTQRKISDKKPKYKK